jgi:two-component system chemotaxis response regulator CheB
MRDHDVIVAGASAGGVEALQTLVAGFPADLPAAVLVVLHISPTGRSMLPRILERAGPLPATAAKDGELIEHGHIYVAPPDYHLVVDRGRIELSRGPRENRSRPSIDVLFRSAVLAYGPRVVGVVLSGSLDDGVAGLRAIKSRGGLAMVQHPADAIFDGMPRSAIEAVDVDYVLPVAEMPPVLSQLAREPVDAAKGAPPSKQLKEEVEMSEIELDLMHNSHHPGKPSAFGCPDCGGVLWEIEDGNLVHYRCRVGHAFGPESLLAAQSDDIEDAMWVALRALEERESLARRLKTRAEELRQTLAVPRYEEQIKETHGRAEVLRRLLLTGSARELPEQAE